jgi:hypothetical protein
VPKVGLQGAGIMPLVREGGAAGVPQHMRVSPETKLSSATSTLYKPAKPAVVKGERSPSALVSVSGRLA